MKKTVILALFLFLFMVTVVVQGNNTFIGFGSIEEIKWGGIEKDWPNIYKMTNVTKVKGPDGMLGIRLADNSPEYNDNTDILLHFDKISFGSLKIDSEAYKLKYSDVYPSITNKVIGKGAAVFQHIGSRIELQPLETSLFYPGNSLQSFTVSFYLYPTMIFDDETVISMIAPNIENGNKLSGFNLIFKNGKLTWNFQNIFTDSKGNEKDIKITELNSSPMYEWHHHILYYDANRGLITLYVDGRESAIEWVTDDGTENGTILKGIIPDSLTVPLTIGGSYVGYMDEFMVSSGEEKITEGKYKNYGKLVSDILHFEGKIINVAKLKWDADENNGTAVRLFYRVSNNYFIPDDEEANDLTEGKYNGTKRKIKLKNEPEWKIAKNGEIIRKSGKYFQWKALLYGTNMKYTPVLKSLQLFYEEDFPPSKPILLDATPGDKTITLKWIANKEIDISGYRIYYGFSSHNYFGKGSTLGDSPITLGNVTSVILKGLTNERVYFISITAIDKSGQESNFSNELISRPSSIYKKY